MVVDYLKGKIYKLVNDNSDDVYIGSTCQSLAKRIGQHRREYQYYLDGKCGNAASFKLFENGGKVSIVLIEEFLCDNKEQLHKQERYYVDLMKCVNKVLLDEKLSEQCKHNREKEAERKTKKESCDNCNKQIAHGNMAIHKKTNKCMDYVKPKKIVITLKKAD